MLHKLNAPHGQSPEAWLVRYDAAPRVIPQWPASTRMALVAVSQLAHELSAQLLTEPSDVNKFVEIRTLYFVVPSSVVRAAGVCPTLPPEDERG